MTEAFLLAVLNHPFLRNLPRVGKALAIVSEPRSVLTALEEWPKLWVFLSLSEMEMESLQMVIAEGREKHFKVRDT